METEWFSPIASSCRSAELARRRLGPESISVIICCLQGREAQFELLTNDNFYKELQVGPLFMSAMGRSNFYGMVVDSMWATVSMAAVITLRGKVAPTVAIAIFHQLEQLNMHVGNLLSVNDVCAQRFVHISESPQSITQS